MNIAISLCPNDIFTFSGLLLNTVPNSYNIQIFELGELNKNISDKSYDFIKVSSLNLIRNAHYSATCVGASLAREKGPQLVKAKGSKPSGNKIIVPSLHATATKLAHRYFPHFKAEECPLNRISELVSSGEFPYGIIINEDMNRLDELGLETVVDLGLKWNSDFEAILPLGVIGAKISLHTDTVKCFERLVDDSLRWAQNNKEAALELTKKYTGKKDINSDHIQLFTQDAHFNPLIPEYLEKLEKSLIILEG